MAANASISVMDVVSNSTAAMTRAPLLCSQIFDPTTLDNGPDLGRGEDRQRRPNSLHRTGRAFWFKAQLGWLSA
jgi:hypothetical protein